MISTKLSTGTKGFRQYSSATIYRRINALIDNKLITYVGCKPGWVKGESMLYILSLKGKANLRLDEKRIEEFLTKATEEELMTFLDLYN